VDRARLHADASQLFWHPSIVPRRLTEALVLVIEKCHRRRVVTDSSRNTPLPIVETLWTAVAVASVTAIFHRIEQTTSEQREELARQAALDARDSLPALLKPYETEVTRETLLLTLG
jgi:hypothetical protein